jgi:hypothetical protein
MSSGSRTTKKIAMNYEQKYAKALWQMKELYNRVKYLSSTEALLVSQTLENTFPELKESEDERIKRCIGMCLTDATEQRFEDFNTNLKDCLAWLEKQGEQEWSEEDELNLKQAIYVCHQNGYTAVENWLKSLKPHWKPSKELLKSLPKWKEAHEHKEFPLHVCVMDENMYPFLDTEANEGDYYIELSDLKTLPKEE